MYHQSFVHSVDCFGPNSSSLIFLLYRSIFNRYNFFPPSLFLFPLYLLPSFFFRQETRNRASKDLTLRSLRSFAPPTTPHLPWSYFNSSVPHPSRRCLRTPRIGFFRYTSRPHGFLHPAPAGSHWQPPAPAEST
ncbi:hypothetical protein BDV32DRAFT_32254 [Aspergillus pseudonomiae]|nr:hypothetical protein BDV32DRAFT_32254 [Aspergillus pseudonomiae]